MSAEWEMTLQYIAVLSVGLVCSTFDRQLICLFNMDASASQKKMHASGFLENTNITQDFQITVNCKLLLISKMWQQHSLADILFDSGQTIYLRFSTYEDSEDLEKDLK